MKNKFGLSRHIPSKIKYEIRKRSKYGCVVCRCGIYQYEHIDPEFENSQEHNADNMCCLCGRCHDKVTRSQLSKEAVRSAYHKVQNLDNIQNPKEFFDFHTGDAHLIFGELVCNPIPTTVFRCYEKDVFSIIPGNENEPGKINAIFSDEKGNPMFEILGNEWIGPTSYFDLEIVGQRFTVKLPNGRVFLKLRHVAPGKIIIQQLDMRYKDVHLLASEFDFALGKYNGYGNNLIWLHVKARIDQLFDEAIAIEVKNTEGTSIEYEKGISATIPGIIFNQTGRQENIMRSWLNPITLQNETQSGIHYPALGFHIAKDCGFAVCAVSTGVCSLEHARKHFFSINRMNVRQTFLPGSLNPENIKREQEISNLFPKLITRKYLKEPFLVMEDTQSIKDWKQRQISNPQSIILSPFLDDRPGCYGAWGIIKLIDSYDGPSIRIAKA